MDEAAFIAALRALATHPAARGFNDDCAVLDLGAETLILTHDAIAQGVHFLADADPADVAWRLVATNISDLAAKGAEPLGVLLGYTLGADDARFLTGLAEALAEYNVPLLGGDTIRTGCPPTHGLTALGRATHRPVPARSGAQAGDGLWITGAVGAAMIGYEALCEGSTDAALTAPYRRPRALLAQGQALAPHVTAMMDVSDGLLLDAARLARASGVTLAIDSAAVPLCTALGAAPEPRRADALRWGDDYQLLFTLPPCFDMAGQTPPIPATQIGKAIGHTSAPIILDGAPLSEADGLGYRH